MLAYYFLLFFLSLLLLSTYITRLCCNDNNIIYNRAKTSSQHLVRALTVGFDSVLEVIFLF